MKNIHNNFSVLKLISILLATLFILGLSGCGKSPQGVVIQFLKDINAGNTEAAKKACSKNFMAKFGGRFDKMTEYRDMIKSMPNAPKDPFADLTEDKLQCNISGSTARVTFTDMPLLTIVLTKEQMFWKIDDFDMDFAKMGEMMKGMNLPGNMGDLADKIRQRREEKK
jgi:hypothetical protein